jgi:hypothetical protein
VVGEELRVEVVEVGVGEEKVIGFTYGEKSSWSLAG